MRKILLSFFLIACTLLLHASTFTPGNIVIVRVGTGTGTLTNASTQVFLDEYTTAGVLVQSIAAPTGVSGSNHALTMSGTATTEGALALSPNGLYLTFMGYDTTTGYANVSTGITNRTIGIVGANGVINTSTGFLAGSAYVNGNIRSAVTKDGNEFWTAGSGGTTGGVWYLPAGSFSSAGVLTGATVNTVRVVNIFNGQLYFSTNESPTGIYTDSTGLPTTTGQAETMLPGLPTADTLNSPFAFIFLNENGSSTPNVLYAVDNDVTATDGGIYKYSLVNGSWVTNGRVANANGLTGLTGYATCSGAKLYTTSTGGIYTFYDSTGYNHTINGSFTQIVTAATNTSIKGVAFTPGTVIPTSPVVSIASHTNVTCNGYNNGTITISVTGGASPLSYHWTDGNTGANRTNLPPAAYSVTVTDNNGCTSTAGTTIAQPNAIAITDSVTNVACFGGSTGAVKIAVTGGTGSYHYQWSDSAHTQNISALTIGTYRVKVTDSLGCSSVDSGIVTQPSALGLTQTVTEVSCYGSSTGAIRDSAIGGTPGYSYLWTGGSTAQNRTGLSQGPYSVTVTDHNGCTASASATITQPNLITITDSVTNLPCTGGSTGAIDIRVTGGTGSYHYQWSDSAHTQDISSLTAGTYRVKVTDSLGCSNTDSAYITQAGSLRVVDTVSAVTCYGLSDGAIRVTVTGGTPAYSYRWSGSNNTTSAISGLAQGSYTLTVGDQAGCLAITPISVGQPNPIGITINNVTNLPCTGGSTGAISIAVAGGTGSYHYQWSDSAHTEDISALTVGTYRLKVTDSLGCTAFDSATVTQAGSFVISDSVVSPSCYGLSDGAIILTVTGGTPAYSYRWSGSSDTTATISGIPQSSYTVTVADHAGCVEALQISVVQPDSLSLYLTAVNDSTHGAANGSITLSVSGGTGAYSFTWSNAATTQDISGLTAGPYCVTVTDQNACRDSGCASISQPNGINGVEWANTFIVYTSAGYIEVSFSTIGQMNISAELYVLTGQLVYKSVPVYGSKLDLQIPEAAISSGSYIVRMITDEGSLSKKIIVMK